MSWHAAGTFASSVAQQPATRFSWTEFKTPTTSKRNSRCSIGAAEPFSSFFVGFFHGKHSRQTPSRRHYLLSRPRPAKGTSSSVGVIPAENRRQALGRTDRSSNPPAAAFQRLRGPATHGRRDDCSIHHGCTTEPTQATPRSRESPHVVEVGGRCAFAFRTHAVRSVYGPRQAL